MHKLFLLLASVSGALAVAIGAFGAHGLRRFLESSNRLDTFETAVKYQMYHTLALLLVGLLFFHFPFKTMEWSGWCFLVGILIFSGSLYILCLSGITWLGAITPIGGLFLIAGWLLLGWSVYKA